MLRRVALLGTDVSEEHSASIIRVTRIGEVGKTLAVTGKLLVRANVVPSSPILVTLMMEALFLRNIPEDACIGYVVRCTSSCIIPFPVYASYPLSLRNDTNPYLPSESNSTECGCLHGSKILRNKSSSSYSCTSAFPAQFLHGELKSEPLEKLKLTTTKC
jgi:hypothetical protein